MTAAVFSLVGTLLGAMAALIGSAWVDRRRARRDEELRRRERREAAYAQALRHLLRANRIYGAPFMEFHKLQEDPEWINDLIEAQFWLRTLTIHCGPEQADRLNLLAFRLDEAVTMEESDFKKGYTILIVSTCLKGLIEHYRSEIGVNTATATKTNKPRRARMRER